MAVDYSFMENKVKNLTQFYALICRATRHPYVECDAETFDDQTYIFCEKKDAEEFAEDHPEHEFIIVFVKRGPVSDAERKQGIMQMGEFYTDLYLSGVNRVAVDFGSGPAFVELTKIVQMNPITNEDKKPPKINAALQLTIIYFLQELRRKDADIADVERQSRLRELEEEMKANIEKSTYIIPVLVDPKKVNTADPSKPGAKAVIIPGQRKDGTPDAYQVIFSDMWECQTFFGTGKRTQGIQLLTVPHQRLKDMLAPGTSGYMLNPRHSALIMVKGQL